MSWILSWRTTPSSSSLRLPELAGSSDIRSQHLQRLYTIAQRLPNGLLQRLVDDAAFFDDVNKQKTKARNSARASQFNAWKQKAEDKYFKSLDF